MILISLFLNSCAKEEIENLIEPTLKTVCVPYTMTINSSTIINFEYNKENDYKLMSMSEYVDNNERYQVNFIYHDNLLSEIKEDLNGSINIWKILISPDSIYCQNVDKKDLYIYMNINDNGLPVYFRLKEMLVYYSYNKENDLEQIIVTKNGIVKTKEKYAYDMEKFNFCSFVNFPKWAYFLPLYINKYLSSGTHCVTKVETEPNSNNIIIKDILYSRNYPFLYNYDIGNKNYTMRINYMVYNKEI